MRGSLPVYLQGCSWEGQASKRLSPRFGLAVTEVGFPWVWMESDWTQTLGDPAWDPGLHSCVDLGAGCFSMSCSCCREVLSLEDR